MNFELLDLIYNMCFDPAMQGIISDPEIISNHPLKVARTQLYSKNAVDQSFNAYQEYHDRTDSLEMSINELQDNVHNLERQLFLLNLMGNREVAAGIVALLEERRIDIFILANVYEESRKKWGAEYPKDDPRRFERGEAPDVNPNYKGIVKLIKKDLNRINAKNVLQMVLTIAWHMIATNLSDCFRTTVIKGGYKRDENGDFVLETIMVNEDGEVVPRRRPVAIPDTKKIDLKDEIQNIVNFMKELKDTAEYVEQGKQLLVKYLQNPKSLYLHSAEMSVLETILTPEYIKVTKENLGKMTDPKASSLQYVLNGLDTARKDKEAAEGLEPTPKPIGLLTKEEAEIQEKAGLEAIRQREIAAAAAKAKAEAEKKAREEARRREEDARRQEAERKKEAVAFSNFRTRTKK